MRRIKNFKDYRESVELADLGKVYLAVSSDKNVLSGKTQIAGNVSELLFRVIAPPGVYPDSIDPDMPVYSYGARELTKDLIKGKAIRRKNLYNRPGMLHRASNKVKFHETMGDRSFIPKTVFDMEKAKKLKFPIIGKIATGSRGRGIEVFKTLEDLNSYEGDAHDLYCEMFDLKTEYRVLSMKSNLLYVAERKPDNAKSKRIRESVESSDVFMEDDSDTSRYKWVKKTFGKGIPDRTEFEKIAKKAHELLELDVIGLDIGIDESGKLWLIEVNTCPDLNSEQLALLYLAIFEDFYGRKPDRYTMDRIRSLQKELKRVNGDDIKFSAEPKSPNTDKTVKDRLEKSFGNTFKDIKAKYGQ